MRTLTFCLLSLHLSWVGSVNAADSMYGDAENGQRLFSQFCALCHGDDGRGRQNRAPDLKKEWQRLSVSDSLLADRIRNGYRSPGRIGSYDVAACPPNPLPRLDIDDILAFLRRISMN